MIEITPPQARVIGSLIEKEITTPEQYPLSLNALTLACNQKSNREPVMDMTPSEVQGVIDELTKKNLVAEVVFGSRVPKYKHRFCNSEFSQMHFDAKALGVLCVLFLRGPQTPGELRSRTARMCTFRDVDEVEEVLSKLASGSAGTFVEKLPRVPGKRESRFRHLFFSEEELSIYSESQAATAELNPSEVGKGGLGSRVEQLESEVAELREELQSLRQAWDDLNS